MKQRVIIELDSEIILKLRKVSKKKLLTFKELLEDTIRKSALRYSKKSNFSKLKSDKFLNYFSRK